MKIEENRLRWYSGSGYCYVDVDSILRYGQCDWTCIATEGDKIRPIDEKRAAAISKIKTLVYTT